MNRQYIEQIYCSYRKYSTYIKNILFTIIKELLKPLSKYSFYIEGISSYFLLLFHWCRLQISHQQYEDTELNIVKNQHQNLFMRKNEFSYSHSAHWSTMSNN